MRRYETTYILRPNLGETQFTEVIDRTNDIITNDGGAIISLERWGVKKLAYEIRKENHGYYIHFDFATPATTVQEMERIFKLDDRVLRFLTIKTAESIDQETIEAETELAAAVVVAQQEEETAESSETESETEETKKDATVETDAEDVAEEKDSDEDEEVAEEDTKKETEAVEEAETEDTPSKEEPSAETSEEDKK